MPFPRTFAALKAAGYRFSNHGRCGRCQAEIEWWTRSDGKSLPFDPMPRDESPAVAHAVTCGDE
jgi:hypothetical protein